MASEHTVASLHEHIAALAKAHPEKIALLGIDERGNPTDKVTYRILLERVSIAAGELKEMGLKPGDRIALAFRNSPDLLVWSWAAWASGVVTVPMDTKRDTQELYEYKINLNKAKFLILERGIQVEKLPGVRIKVHTGFEASDTQKTNWMNGLSHQSLVLFTSGTTGHPKGAMLSLQNLVVNAEGIREWLRITADDTFLVVLPLHHINSTTFCLATLLAGGTVAIPPTYSNSHFWTQVAKSGATITSVVQSIVFDQLKQEESFAAQKKSIKLSRVQIGSAPVLAQSVQEFNAKFGSKLYQGYGQTETALRVTGVPMDIPEALYEKLVEENSIGEPMKWADLQISDDAGKFLAEGEEGELVVKGPAVMEGYLGLEPAFRDGYFLTGDIGYFTVVDGRKFFYLKGRKREIIIKGGINISPAAVENALKKISDEIDQVYAVPVTDPRYGEEVGIVICWKKGTDEEHAKQRLKAALLLGTPYLSAYETPRYLTSFPLEELPMTSTGKVQRSVLKTNLPYERFESVFGLLKLSDRRFTVLHRDSRWLKDSYAVYQKCWGALAEEQKQYEKNLSKHLIILAVDSNDKILGQISVVRTGRSAQELLAVKYGELLTPSVLDPEGDALVCISICSAEYEPKPVPDATKMPTEKEVVEYLPNDPVMKFHQKAKGGQKDGASLVGVIPGGRPEDASSLGYNMLLEYPAPKGEISITEGAPVSNQLIEVVLLLAKDLGLSHVFAYSRPGGLAVHFANAK